MLDIQGAKSSPGAKIILYSQKSGKADNQLWFEDAQGNIRSKLSEKLVLDGSGKVFDEFVLQNDCIEYYCNSFAKWKRFRNFDTSDGTWKLV